MDVRQARERMRGYTERRRLERSQQETCSNQTALQQKKTTQEVAPGDMQQPNCNARGEDDQRSRTQSSGNSIAVHTTWPGYDDQVHSTERKRTTPALQMTKSVNHNNCDRRGIGGGMGSQRLLQIRSPGKTDEQRAAQPATSTRVNDRWVLMVHEDIITI